MLFQQPNKLHIFQQKCGKTWGDYKNTSHLNSYVISRNIFSFLIICDGRRLNFFEGMINSMFDL